MLSVLPRNCLGQQMQDDVLHEMDEDFLESDVSAKYPKVDVVFDVLLENMGTESEADPAGHVLGRWEEATVDAKQNTEVTRGRLGPDEDVHRARRVHTTTQYRHTDCSGCVTPERPYGRQ